MYFYFTYEKNLEKERVKGRKMMFLYKLYVCVFIVMVVIFFIMFI